MTKIVVATNQHAKQILELENELFLVNKFNLNQISNEIKNENRHYIVAVLENKVVAYAGVNLGVDVAEIMKIAVNKNHQNKGLATRLINNLISFCKLQKYNKIILEVSDKNVPALLFYKKIGFKKIHIRKNYYQDFSDAIICELNI